MELLTHSRMESARRCLRAHYYEYELRISAVEEAEALSFGSAMHKGVAVWRQTKDVSAAMIALYECAFHTPIAAAQALALMEGYCGYWHDVDANRNFVAVEMAWSLPLINPDTNAASRTYTLAGKLDALDSEHVVWETKTTSESIDAESRYWQILAINPQISNYFRALQNLGYTPTKVCYDVIKKPLMRPSQVPVLDEAGLKIVLDTQTGDRVYNKNGQPRQTGSKEEGYTLQTRTETVEEYADRLRKDIAENPSKYFARREITLLEDDLEDYAVEFWGIGLSLNHARRTGHWFRNVSTRTCTYCEYAPLCLNSVHVDPKNLPAGFVRVENPHAELMEDGA
jgi:hypothetical protein